MPPGSPAGETDVKPTSGETVSILRFEIRKMHRKKEGIAIEISSDTGCLFAEIQEDNLLERV